MDIFVILDPDPHEILCGSETLDTVTDFDRDAGYPIPTILPPDIWCNPKFLYYLYINFSIFQIQYPPPPSLYLLGPVKGGGLRDRLRSD